MKIKTEINEKEMKVTIAKISKSKSWFFERIKNLTNHQPDLSRKKGRGQIKLEMKKEKLKQIIQKYKRS